VARDPVHVNDLHATVLHLLGIDHSQFTYRFQGIRLRGLVANLAKSKKNDKKES
jgi:arylsulfatase A-like enzyme